MSGHRFEQAVKVYLVLNEAGDAWVLDTVAHDIEHPDELDGLPKPDGGECTCGWTIPHYDAAIAASKVPLPTLSDLRVMLDDAHDSIEVPKVQVEQRVVCETFQWIGQSFAHCDRCSLPYWEHTHDERYRGSPFSDGGSTKVAITAERAAAVKAKWGQR